jgi:TatD DNase family protein
MLDTHCHIQFNAFKDDAEEVIKRCQDKNCAMVVVGSQKDTSERAIKYAEKHGAMYATIGLHPVHTSHTEVDEEEINFKTREENFDYELYKKMAGNKKVVAIGECGIELFHIPEGMTKEEILDKQIPVFEAQIKLAQELNLPLIIHIREAYEETYEILKKHGVNHGVIHCYTGNWENGAKFLDLGLHLGFTGVITFPPKKTSPQDQIKLLEVVRECPIDKILIETDAPYLAPQKYRGERAEPWMIEETAEKIGEIKGLLKEEVLRITEKNGRILFGISLDNSPNMF